MLGQLGRSPWHNRQVPTEPDVTATPDELAVPEAPAAPAVPAAADASAARDASAAPERSRGRMPNGLRIFLVYAGAILTVIGLSLRFVIDLAVSASVSLVGVVVMVLLAYTIFTVTVVLQRKQVARGLALGLASLTIPAIPLGYVSFPAPSAGIAAALFAAALAITLFRGLLRPDVRAYLDQP